jgi:hypothetical protein
MRAINGREQDGRDERVRKNLGRVRVTIELVINEEGRGLFYTWRERATPLGSLPSVKSRARVMISRRGTQL